MVSLSAYHHRAYLKTGTLFANAAASAALLAGDAAVGGSGDAGWDFAAGAPGVGGRGGEASLPFWDSLDGPAAQAAGWAMQGEAPPPPTPSLLPPRTLASAAAAAAAFGAHLGLAFQVIDDALDYSSPASLLGKPALADAAAGVVTAPVLLAMEQEPELATLARRRFKRGGDPARTAELVRSGSGVALARDLASSHAAAAVAALERLPATADGDALRARAALAELALRVVDRVK